MLKQIHKEMNLETVEKIMEETAEAREYQREIDEMLASNLTVEDEEAVQAELRELQREALGEEPEREIKLPSAPDTVPVVAAPEEALQEPAPEPERERVPVLA